MTTVKDLLDSGAVVQPSPESTDRPLTAEDFTALADLYTIKGWLHGLATAPDLTDVVADGGVSVGDCYQQEARDFADRIGRFIIAYRVSRPTSGASEGGLRSFVPISGQLFSSEQDWINRASRALTRHPEYNNTEHGETTGWRGPHFTVLCFDQAGNRMRQGSDFKRATAEGTYPVWWVWPDQIIAALTPSPPVQLSEREREAVDDVKGRIATWDGHDAGSVQVGVSVDTLRTILAALTRTTGEG